MTDQAVEDEIRELAFMSLRQYPIYSALLRQIDAARKERDEVLAALRNRLDAEKGCANAACNIGGGLCADCSVLAEDRKGEAAGIVAKYKKGGE
jgi:hypothetical protein